MIRLSSFALLAAAALPAAGESVKLISMDQVEKRLGQAGFAVFDVNTPEVWEKNRLPGAIHVTGRNLERLLPADRSTQLVFYCADPR